MVIRLVRRDSPRPPCRGRAPTLEGYVFRQLPAPALLAAICLALSLLSFDLVGLMELWIGRGVGIATVGRIALFDSLDAFSRMLPLAVVVGGLLVAGGLRAHHELLGAETAGVAPLALLRPFARFGALTALLGLALSHFGAPWAQRGIQQTLTEVARAHPIPPLEPGAPKRLGKWRIEAEHVSTGGRVLGEVALWVPGARETLFARRAILSATPSGVGIALEEGVALLGLPDPSAIRFRRLERELPLAGITAAGWLQAATPSELAAARRGDLPGTSRRDADAEWHRRFALPLAALPLAMLSLPVAIRFGRASRAGNLLVGTGLAFAFYAMVLIANAAVQGRSLPVVAGIWLPDVVLAVAAALLLLRRPARPRARVPRPAPRRASPSAQSILAHRHALGRHVVSTFLSLGLLGLAALLVAFAVADSLDNLKWFVKYDATPLEALRYEAARWPVLASRALPYALLGAAAIVLGVLEQSGELGGMRASGISPLRIAFPILLVCGIAVPFSHVLSNEIAPRASALSTRLKRTEIKDRAENTSLWVRSGSRFFVAPGFDARAGLARRIAIFDLDSEGMPLGRTDASEGRHVGAGVWHLLDPARVELRDGEFARARAEPFIELGSDLPSEVVPAHLSLGELQREVRAAGSRGHPVSELRAYWHSRLAAPLTCLLLPALALLGAAHRVPHPSPARSLLRGVAAGAAYLSLESAFGALGAAGRLPALVAGWAPTALLVGAVGALVLRHLGHLSGPGGTQMNESS